MWYKQEGCPMKPKDAESMEVDMETMHLRTTIVEKEWWGGKTARPRLTNVLRKQLNFKFDFKFSKHVSKFRF
tara:strand:+ start:243 stop:458 length:216 start_codon:yes stop_codon:yes gene_type:complete